MSLISFRSVLVLALLLFILPTPAQPQSYQTWSEKDLYGHGKDRLLQGSDLGSAIAMLSSLVERKPGDAEYQMMLGCACVSRLASLHCATEDAKIVESAGRSYQKRVKIWKAMQDDNTLPLFGKPEPVAPVDPTTPDDGKACDPLDTAAQKRVSELSLLALHSFHEAIRLDRSLTPKHKIQVDYTCGWGLLLLYRSARESIKFQEVAPPVKADSAPLPLPVTPDDKILTQKEILACFQACVEADSRKADYWQALAFANAPDYLTDDISLLNAEKIAASKANRIAEAVQSMQRALAIKRADPDLLYQTALLSSLALPDKALDSLKKLTLVQNTNHLAERGGRFHARRHCHDGNGQERPASL